MLSGMVVSTHFLKLENVVYLFCPTLGLGVKQVTL